MPSQSKDSVPIALFEAEGRARHGTKGCLFARLCRPPTAGHAPRPRATIGKHRRQTQPGLSKLRGGMPRRQSCATMRSANDERNANLGWNLRSEGPTRQSPNGETTLIRHWHGIDSSRPFPSRACPARCAPGSSAEKGRGGGRPGRLGCGSRLAGESPTSESRPALEVPRFRIASRRALAHQNLRGSPLRKRRVSRPAQ